MEEELKSEGKCIYCVEMVSQRAMSEHLGKHLSEIEKNAVDKKTKIYYHIVVEAYEMFLQLLVESQAKMKVIDNFLRDIWLECCGHMSSFYQKDYQIKMKENVGDVFNGSIKIFHDYDFGSTTTVSLKSINNYDLNINKDIMLLSRNEPLKIMCATCGKKPAVSICVTCNCEEYAFFCEECAKKHRKTCSDFIDYGELPVVNSPRMGVCGYEGGSIDKERDGIFRG